MPRKSNAVDTEPSALAPELERLLAEVQRVVAQPQHDEALDAYRGIVDRARSTVVAETLSVVLRDFGARACEMGQHGLAQAAFRDALDLHRMRADAGGEGWCLLLLARLATSRAELDRADELLGLGRRAFESVEDHLGLAYVLRAQGELRTVIGDDDDLALRLLRQARELFAALDRAPQEAEVLVQIGQLHVILGRAREACASLERALALSRGCGDETTVAGAHFWLGMQHEKRRRLAAARVHFAAARTNFENAGDLRGLGFSCFYLGTIAIRERDSEEARANLLAARVIFLELAEPIALASVSISLGHLLTAEGRQREARSELEDGLEQSRALGFLAGQAHALLGLAMLVGKEDRIDEARALFARARALYAEEPHPINVAYTDLAEGRLLLRAGLHEEGVTLVGYAFDNFAKAGHAPADSREQFVASVLVAVGSSRTLN